MATCATCEQESPEGFKFCGSCGAPLEAAPPAREVRKVVTIVFCDLTGSTALGDRTDPEALRATMRGYYEEMRAILERHGGTVEKFVGDAVMAVFGVPLSHEDDALRAVRAAWEMREAVPKLGLQARIGVNTGEVVAGEGDTLVTGDAVNVAARLEQAAAAGDVLIGDETRRLVRDAAVVEPVQIEAKGKPDPLAGFRVLDLDKRASGIARNLDAPLVGRRRELGLLHQAYDWTVSERSCHLFTLMGTAGVGKSRLVAELVATLDATVVQGRCLNYGEGITLWPIVEVLKALAAEDTVAQINGSLAGPNELFLIVRRRLEAAAAQRPLVVVFDDVHWGEPFFLDLVDHIADLSRSVPLLLVCVARPELLDERPNWGGGKLNATTVLLEPLSAEDSRSMLVALAGDSVDAETRQRILETAAGNPLFVEEMLALAREGVDVRATSTVQALLQARLDRLGSAERSAIERAAVEGEVFHRGSVTELSGTSVDDELVALIRKELIRPDRATFPDDEAYRFRHLLVRDAAYDALPKETRAELHLRFANWIERHPDLVELDEIVGYHLERAVGYLAELGRPDAGLAMRAGAHLAAGGRKAAARGDHPSAVKLLERAAPLFPRHSEVGGATLLALAESLVELAEYDRVRATLAPLLDGPDERLRTHARLLSAAAVFAYDAKGATEPARALLSEVVPELERDRDIDGLVRAATLEFWIHWSGSQAGLAYEAVTRVYELADQAHLQRHRAWSLEWRAIAVAFGPFPASAIAERAAELEAAGPGAAHAAGNVRTYEQLFAGNYDDARAYYAVATERTKALGLEALNLAMTMVGAMVETTAGRDADAVEMLRPSAQRLDELGITSYSSTSYVRLAEAYYAIGELDLALDAAKRGLQATADEDLINFVAAYGVQARVMADRGAIEEASALARSAVVYAEQTDMPTTRGDAYLVLAEVARTAGDLGAARSALERARVEYEIKQFIPMLERVDALLVEL